MGSQEDHVSSFKDTLEVGSDFSETAWLEWFDDNDIKFLAEK